MFCEWSFASKVSKSDNFNLNIPSFVLLTGLLSRIARRLNDCSVSFRCSELVKNTVEWCAVQRRMKNEVARKNPNRWSHIAISSSNEPDTERRRQRQIFYSPVSWGQRGLPRETTNCRERPKLRFQTFFPLGFSSSIGCLSTVTNKLFSLCKICLVSRNWLYYQLYNNTNF